VICIRAACKLDHNNGCGFLSEILDAPGLDGTLSNVSWCLGVRRCNHPHASPQCELVTSLGCDTQDSLSNIWCLKKEKKIKLQRGAYWQTVYSQSSTWKSSPVSVNSSDLFDRSPVRIWTGKTSHTDNGTSCVSSVPQRKWWGRIVLPGLERDCLLPKLAQLIIHRSCYICQGWTARRASTAGLGKATNSRPISSVIKSNLQ
jgi:hypothetical protein